MKKSWQEAEAVERYRLISPLLSDDLDKPGRNRLRSQIAENSNDSKGPFTGMKTHGGKTALQA